MEEQQIHKFRVRGEADREGSSWWGEDNCGFATVAGTLPQLKSLINEQVEEEWIGKCELLMPNVQSGIAAP